MLTKKSKAGVTRMRKDGGGPKEDPSLPTNDARNDHTTSTDGLQKNSPPAEISVESIAKTFENPPLKNLPPPVNPLEIFLKEIKDSNEKNHRDMKGEISGL